MRLVLVLLLSIYSINCKSVPNEGSLLRSTELAGVLGCYELSQYVGLETSLHANGELACFEQLPSNDCRATMNFYRSSEIYMSSEVALAVRQPRCLNCYDFISPEVFVEIRGDFQRITSMSVDHEGVVSKFDLKKILPHK